MKARQSNQESVIEVMERVSHADLLSHYLGITSLPVLINSPLREDRHPSFFIYSPDGIRVLYRDYATGDKGDIYSLLSLRDHISFGELIRKISTEKAFTKANININPHSPIRRFPRREPSDIRVKIRAWKKYDIDYWKSYGISVDWLKFADVYPISHKIVYKDGNRYVFHAAKLAYVFVERKEGNISYKIYQPLSKNNYKWSTNNDRSVVGLWSKIPAFGDKLVICSSLKDALCLWENTGIPAIYVQSETTSMSNTAQEALKNRFKQIYICFDNDAPGLKDANSFSLQTGFKNIVLPFFDGGKDISDAFKLFGREWFIENIKPLFNI